MFFYYYENLAEPRNTAVDISFVIFDALIEKKTKTFMNEM